MGGTGSHGWREHQRTLENDWDEILRNRIWRSSEMDEMMIGLQTMWSVYVGDSSCDRSCADTLGYSKGLTIFPPPSSKRKKRLPYTPEIITKLRQHLKLNDPFDAAVFACLTTCFYAAAQVAEFVVPRLDAFSPSQHIIPASLQVDNNLDGLEVTVLHLPHTKAAPLEGEDMFWSSHPGPTDPYATLNNHLQVNHSPDNTHLFAYQHKGQLRPLTKPAFIKCLASAACDTGLEPLQGHGIRIGATLIYLLHGLPIEAMKVMGCWSSDAFLRYLRKHAQILTC